jgi:hypothetical protein
MKCPLLCKCKSWKKLTKKQRFTLTVGVGVKKFILKDCPLSDFKVEKMKCEKVLHTGEGYLHGEDDDTPFLVDGVTYCGRCHAFDCGGRKEERKGKYS